MKKHIAYLTLAAAVLTATSCGDWLDVMQDDNIPEKELFASYDGFRNATNGIYQSLAEEDLFGMELSYGFVTALSQYLRNNSTNARYWQTEMYNYDTKEVRNYAERIWKKSYNVIANCNNLIQHLEKADPEIFPDPNEYRFMTGEAYGVRALMHFELLRLFGPVPAVGMDAKAIPYVDAYPSMLSEHATTRQVFARIIEDFEYAFELLEPYDYPTNSNKMQTSSRFQKSTIVQELFFASRGFRMNSLAVKSLLARVYAYMGDLENANLHATEAYTAGAVDKNFLPYTSWPTSGTAVQPRKMVNEVIFALYDLNLAENYEPRATTNSNAFFQLKNVDYMYQTFRNDATDVRLVILSLAQAPTSSGDNKRYISLRYCYRSDYPGTDNSENYLIPVIRMPELRYIMAEYTARNGDIPGAVAILNEHRTKRKATRAIQATITLDEFMEELLYDMWKEFTAEGQLFFQYKRLNAPTIPTGATYITMTPEKYVLPIPDSEIRF